MWGEGVQARRRHRRVGVEHDHPALPVGGRGEAVGDVGDEVAFRVDHQHAAAGGGVVEHQPGQQGGFPGAGGADDVQVVAGVGDRQPHRPPPPPPDPARRPRLSVLAVRAGK